MYEELVKRLRGYSAARKGEIAELTKAAADAIGERCQQVDKFMQEAALLNAKQPR